MKFSHDSIFQIREKIEGRIENLNLANRINFNIFLVIGLEKFTSSNTRGLRL